MSETQRTVIKLPVDVRLAVPRTPVFRDNLNKFAAVHITARAVEAPGIKNRLADEQVDGDMLAATRRAVRVGEFHFELGRMLMNYCSEYVAFPDRIEVVLDAGHSEEDIESAIEMLVKKFV